VPDYGALGIAGLVAATLAIVLAKVWTAYLKKDEAFVAVILAQNAAYTKLLVDLTVTLDGLKRLIEDRLLGDARNDVRRT
jgi:hypothetical protein